MTDYHIVASRPGGPEVLVREEITVGAPGPRQVRLRHTAVGVNFVDTYFRTGLYPGPSPAPLGGEAAGVVEAVGAQVSEFRPGDRVAYGTGGQGAYASARLIAAEHLVHLPDGLSDETAAAVMLKGMTAAYLIGPCGKITEDMTVLVHSAAGGVGSILVQWLVATGVRVIAHVGTPGKAARVAAMSPDHVLTCGFDMLAEEVKALTDGAGVAVVLDGVGKASWTASLASVATRGLLVTYGNASGAVPSFTALDLVDAGSVFVTRPTLRDYAASGAERQALVAPLFTMIAGGQIGIEIGQRFALDKAADAHRALEARETIGSTILLP